MSTDFCVETTFLDGCLVKIVNRKERVVSYKNCTEDTLITIHAAFTVSTRSANDPKELSRIRPCPQTVLRRTELTETVSTVRASDKKSGSAAAAPGDQVRQVLTFIAKAVLPPNTTRPFILFDLLDDVTSGKEHFATEPCPIDPAFLTFRGGRRRADDVVVSGPDATLMPVIDSTYCCLGNPRDQSGATHWLYRLTADDPTLPAASALVLAKKKTRTQLWAFYNDSVYSVATVRAEFQLGHGESVELCGSTISVPVKGGVAGKRTMALELTVPPLTTALFARVTRRRPSLLESLASPTTTVATACFTDAATEESGFVDCDLDASDDSDMESSADQFTPSASAASSSSVVAFVTFAFHTDPYRSVSPLGMEALSHIALPETVEYDQVFPCPLAAVPQSASAEHVREVGRAMSLSATPRVARAAKTVGGGGGGGGAGGARSGPMTVTVTPRGSGGAAAVLFGRRAAESPLPQRRLSDGRDDSGLLFPLSSSSSAHHGASGLPTTTRTTPTTPTTTDVYLLVDNEDSRWTLCNQGSKVCYRVYVTVYAVASPDSWYTTYSPFTDAAAPTPRTRRGEEVVHVRRAQSQPNAVVVEVLMEPSSVVLLCEGKLPDSYDMVCVWDSVVDTSLLAAMAAANDSQLPSARLALPHNSSSDNNVSGSLLLDRSASGQYMSLPTNALFLESPYLANHSLSPVVGEQSALPDQEALVKGTVAFDGPGPDESVFDYARLYAVFPRHVMTVPQPPTPVSSPTAMVNMSTATATTTTPAASRRSPRRPTEHQTGSLPMTSQPPAMAVPPLNLSMVNASKAATTTTTTTATATATTVSVPPLPHDDDVAHTHLGTNGALFRLVSADGTRWGLYNDTDDLNMFVHATFTMEQNMFGRTLDARQQALGRTQLLITPWQDPAATVPSALASATTGPDAEASLLLFATPKNDDLGERSDTMHTPARAYPSPLPASCQRSRSGSRNVYMSNIPELEGFHSPRMDSRHLSGIYNGDGSDKEAGHIARDFHHALVIVPPRTTVPFLMAVKASDLDGCRFHAWTEVVPLPGPDKMTTPFAHAAELKEACAAKGFTPDEVFEVCRGSSVHATLYKLVDSPMIRLARRSLAPENETDDKRGVTPVHTLDHEAAAALTRCRWAVFNDSDDCCFTVRVTFPAASPVKPVDPEVFMDAASPSGSGLLTRADDSDAAASPDVGDWTVVSGTVTGVTDHEGTTFGTDTTGSLTLADTNSALNRLRIVNAYASPDATSGVVFSSRLNSFPASPRPLPPTLLPPPLTLRTTVWPGEMITLLETMPEVRPLDTHVRADRPPQNQAVNIAFESGNPVIYRNVADYHASKKERLRKTKAPQAELPRHLQGVAEPPRSPVHKHLHVDDMLTTHYLRFYRDYPAAPIYRIINDRDALWSLYNDHTTTTYKVRVVFYQQSLVRPVGSAKDVTASMRERGAAATTTMSGRAVGAPRRSSTPPQQQDQQQHAQRRLSDKAAVKALDADAQLDKILREDASATVVDVVVAPGDTELLVLAEDTRRYVVFLEKQPAKPKS